MEVFANVDSEVNNHVLNYEYVFCGVDLATAVAAYSLARAGKATMVMVPRDADFSDHYLHTTIFPPDFKELQGVKRRFIWMEELRHTFPHLVLQQRTVNLERNTFGNYVKSLLFRNRFANAPHLKPLVIDLNKSVDYQFPHAKEFSFATLSREYRVNVGRLTMEFLREAVKAGCRVAYSDADFTQMNEGCTDSSRVYAASAAGSETWPVSDSIKFPNAIGWSGKSGRWIFTFDKTIGNTCQFMRHINFNSANLLFDQQQLQMIGLDGSEIIVESLLNGVAGGKIPNCNILPVLQPEDISMAMKDIFNLEMVCPTQADCWVESGRELHHLSAVADKLYDEARQTGIDRELFQTYFLRYGSNVREITEMAYERPAGDEASVADHYLKASQCFERFGL